MSQPSPIRGSQADWKGSSKDERKTVTLVTLVVINRLSGTLTTLAAV
jgi:hypothetical protein